MFAKYTLNYLLFDEISLLLLPYIPHSSVFNCCHSFTLLCIERYIFEPSNQQWSFQTLPNYSICYRMFVVKSLCFPPWIICATTVAATAAAALKITALHETTLTASLGLIVCFFSLAIIQELSHDCSRANGEPREYLQRLSVKEIREGLGCPMAGFYWDRQFCSTSPK